MLRTKLRSVLRSKEGKIQQNCETEQQKQYKQNWC